MAEKQPLQSGKTDQTPQAPTEILEQRIETSPFLSGLLQGQGAPPPTKPRQQDVLRMQRLIGNNATQRYLSPRTAISTGASRLHLQRDRLVEDDIHLSLPADLMPYDAFVDLLAHNRALRRRMVARSDPGHIQSILSDHSNLQEIYQQLQTRYSVGANTGPLQIHIQFHYADGEGSSGERVDRIAFSLPEPAIADFEDEGSDISVPEPDPDEPSFGLEGGESRAVFVEEALTILIPDWADMPVVDRAVHLLNMVNRRLMDIGVPMMYPSPQTSLPPGTRAQFDGRTWTIEYMESEFRAADTPAEINRVISDFYHEARHAEQAFLALRFLCQTSWAITQTLNPYPLHIKDAARAANAREPLEGQELVEARQYYNELFANVGVTNAVYAEVDEAAGEVIALRARHAPPDEITAAEQRYHRAQAAYRALVGEADAYDVGDEVRAQLTDANPPD
jgi:hypothetical protein